VCILCVSVCLSLESKGTEQKENIDFTASYDLTQINALQLVTQ